MEILLIMGIPYAAFVILIITLILLTIVRGIQKAKTLFAQIVLYFSEIIYTIVGPIIGFYRFDEFGDEIPFAKQHVLSIILPVIVSSLSFWIARFTAKSANPFLRIIVSVGLLQGIILCFITSIHFVSFIPLGLIYPWAGFELLSPLVALFLLIREFYFYNKVDLDFSELLPYREELDLLPLPIKFLKAPFVKRMFIYGFLLIPFLFVQVLIAYGFGQDIDSIVKAYTHSVGFVFSHKNY